MRHMPLKTALEPAVKQALFCYPKTNHKRKELAHGTDNQRDGFTGR